MKASTTRTLLAAAAAAGLSGCSGTGDPIRAEVLNTCLRVPAFREQVFRSDAEYRSFALQYPIGTTHQDPALDYGSRMLVAHFDGQGSACSGFSVTRVDADDEAVTVHAVRHVSPNPCIAVIAYPQLALAVEARDLPVVWRIRELSGEVPPNGVRACM